MPICVFDIAEDGTTSIPETSDLTGQARYRWWHFDLSDPHLADWCETPLISHSRRRAAYSPKRGPVVTPSRMA